MRRKRCPYCGGKKFERRKTPCALAVACCTKCNRTATGYKILPKKRKKK